jgi:hypothetical protein
MATQAAWHAHQLQRPRISPQPKVRPLKSDEQRRVQKAEKEALDPAKLGGWRQGQAWDIGRHTLLFLADSQTDSQADGKRVAEECWKLWEWLGAPPSTCILWWRDDPRRLAAREWPSKETVNGGWTYQNSNTIHIYRKEEWDRVFLHEMIHALGWDWKMPEKPLACWGLAPNSNTYPALFEAWTELYAEWLWCLWHGDSPAVWGVQLAWQEEQALQILARYRVLGMRSWTEDTSVFAYYVLKAALAPHIAQLLLFGPGDTKTLCALSAPHLAALWSRSRHITPKDMSLRMTTPKTQPQPQS